MERTDDVSEPGSERGFWVGFAIGWGAYFSLTLSYALVVAREPLSQGLLVACGNTLTPVAASWLIALNRRRLLRAERPRGRAVAIYVSVGLGFAAVNTLLAFAFIRLAGLSVPEFEGMSAWVQAVNLVVSSAFLYAVFFGVLMWSESSRRVRESQRLIAQEAVLRAEAEAKAVRAQFNPHFVFNTLHSLMLLVRADPDAAERAIEDVATLIRYASIVQRRDLDAVPLTKELEVARRYVELEQLRIGPRLDVEWDIRVDPDTVTTPAFALQTLVENAIKHGVEPTDRAVIIGVAIEAANGALSISVSDDGVGADPATVDAAPGRGLGLLTRRLELRYGDAATLTWDTAPGSGFRVTARLPEERPARVAALDVIETRHERSTAEARAPA